MEAKEKKKPNQKEHFRLTEAAASWKAVPETRQWFCQRSVKSLQEGVGLLKLELVTAVPISSNVKIADKLTEHAPEFRNS